MASKLPVDQFILMKYPTLTEVVFVYAQMTQGGGGDTKGNRLSYTTVMYALPTIWYSHPQPAT